MMHIVPRTVRRAWLGVLLLGLVACGGVARPAPPTVDAPAPAFALPALGGGEVRLADQQGQVVIVNFWATWCLPCVEETPRLVRWHTQHQADGLQVLGVDVLARDSRASVEAFAQKYQITYPVLLDAEGTVSNQWLAQQLPRSYVVDRQGVIRFARIGELTDDDWEQHIAPLLR